MIRYKNTISGGSSIMQPIRIPENIRNVILVMNLIQLKNLILKNCLDYFSVNHFLFERPYSLCLLIQNSRSETGRKIGVWR